MKITIKQYSQALYEATEGKKSGEISQLIKNFVNILINNRDLTKVEAIIGCFEKICLQEAGIIEADIITARQLDKTIIKSLVNYIIKLTGAKNVIVNEKINSDILGGVIIRYGDKVIDGSIKTRLAELKNEIIK